MPLSVSKLHRESGVLIVSVGLISTQPPWLTPVCLGCSILAAPATAELEPLTDGQVSQTDEVMMVALSPCFSPSPYS